MLNFLTGSGRTNRLGYLFTSMGITFVSILVAQAVLGTVEVDEFGEPSVSAEGIFVLFALVIGSIWLSIANASRRFHDLGYSGWMTLTLFIPLFGIVASLYLLFGSGTPTLNRFGNPPSPLFGGKQADTTADREWLIHAQLQAQAAQAEREASYYDADGKYDMEAMFR